MPNEIDMESDLKAFGKLVRERREARGWAQENLAKAAFSNLDRKGYVSKIERGQQRVKTSTVRSIANALDIDPAEIPSSLRWPEANADLARPNETIQSVYDQVAALVGQDVNNAREIGFRDGTLIELARRYVGGDPKDFESAVSSLSGALEATRQAIKHDELAEADASAYQSLLAKLADIELSIADASTLDVNRVLTMLAKYAAVAVVAIVGFIFLIAALGLFQAPLRQTTIATEGEIWSPGDCYRPEGCPGVRIAKRIYDWSDEDCPLPKVFFGRCQGSIALLLTGRRYISFVEQDTISGLKLAGPFRIETRDPFSIYEQLAETYPDCFAIVETEEGLVLRVEHANDVCKNAKGG